MENYRVVDLILKKRNGLELTKDEISFIINGYVDGKIPEYQISALLMAIYFKGLSDVEMTNLTFDMLHSGDQVDLSRIDGVKVDKHSTGGVGDKTSLVVAPIAAACGIKMAKMSGRGLGHTGGTLDKLESIPGYKIEIDSEDFFKEVNDIGLAIIGQSKNITPADKKLYALRDVTGTIESVGLIASSIMSKKLASGADHIVLDVKVGNGAFMKNENDATILANKMVTIGKLAGIDTCATLTDMNQPLGCAVGNSLEVIEAIETLKGNGPKDFTELCYHLTSEILLIAKFAKDEEESYKMINEVISSGKALEKFKQMIEYQHGDSRVCDDYSLFGNAKKVIEVKFGNNEPLYVSKINALSIGEAAMFLGAGRKEITDDVDHVVGVVLNKKVGDVVNPYETVAYVYSNGIGEEESIEKIKNAYTLSKEKVDPTNIIIKVIR